MRRGLPLRASAGLLAVAISGCAGGAAVSTTPTTPATTSAAPARVAVAHLPPTAKDVIDALLASSQVPLSVDPSCAGAGTEPGDRTIGRYLAGFLAELSDPEARNAIETSVEERGAVWVCRLFVRHAQGEDVWRWGVEFSVRKSDGLVQPESFRCLGAG